MRFLSSALAAFAAGMLVAAVDIGWRHWLDLGDLGYFAYWLAPLVLVVAWLAARYARWSASWPHEARIGLGGAIGGGLGFLWTVFAMGGLDPWRTPFRSLALYAFLVAGVVAMLTATLSSSARAKR